MIFMSQSGLTDPLRLADWDRWYVEHLRVMRTVPGITSAQRFTSETAGYPPSLAIYSVASEAVFHDPYYLSVRGMGDWKPLIDPRFYHRNLFDGLDAAPFVPDDGLLVIADRMHPDPSLTPMTWLKAVGLDLSTPFRGIAVVGKHEFADVAADVSEVGHYAPVPM